MNRYVRYGAAALAALCLLSPFTAKAEDRPVRTDGNIIAVAPFRMSDKAKEDTVMGAIARKELNHALAIANDQIQLYPESAIAYDDRSMVYMLMGKPEEAIRDSRKSVALDPDNGRYRMRLGAEYNNIGKYDEAIKVLEEGLKRFDGKNKLLHNSLYHNLAYSYFAKKDFDKALSLLKEGERVLPRQINNYFLEAAIYKTMGDREKERKAVLTAFSYGAEKDGNYKLAAEMAYRADNGEDALYFWKEAIRKNPKDEDLYGQRGLYYAKTGEYEKAISDLTKALSIKEISMDYNNRGECYRYLKQYGKAREDYVQALKLAKEPYEFHAVYDSLAQWFFDQGDYESAADYFSNALKVKKYPEGYEMRAKAWEKLGYKLKAEEDRKKAEKLRNGA